MSLRLRISLIVTALMLLSVAAAGSILIADARAAIREEIQASTRITSQLLAGVVYSAQLTGSPRDFLLAFMRSLGRVRANEIKLYDPAGDLVYQSPPSSYKAGRSAPDWYARLVGP
ncbi:MAG: methanol utilization protein MoxY, partial [Burkholderiales bacterium]